MTEWRKRKKTEKKENQEISTLLQSIRSPLFISLRQNYNAPPWALLISVPITEFQAALNSGQWIAEGKKLLNSLSIWRHFKVWSSSPTHLLLFTFQSPQIAAPRIPSRLYSCIRWEKQSGVCLLHLTKNQNSAPDLWAGELTCWKFRLESTVAGLTRMDQKGWDGRPIRNLM